MTKAKLCGSIVAIFQINYDQNTSKGDAYSPGLKDRREGMSSAGPEPLPTVRQIQDAESENSEAETEHLPNVRKRSSSESPPPLKRVRRPRGPPEPEEEQSGDDAEINDDSTEEERIRAVNALSEIEVQLAEFRDRLYDEQLARFDIELEMCSNGVHPEIKRFLSSMNAAKNQRISRIQAQRDYQVATIKTELNAMRTSILQNFVRQKFDLRSKLLREKSREWYQVNSERRAADKLVPEFGYSPCGPAPSSQARMELARIAQEIGWPIAPEPAPASEHEKWNDLRHLKQARR